MQEFVGKKCFLVFLDECDNQVKGFFDIKQISEGFVIFNSAKNQLMIPLTRVLKIKMKEEE